MDSGYLAVSSDNITDKIVQMYIEEQRDKPFIDKSQFQIASS